MSSDASNGERPIYREAIRRSTGMLIKQGMSREDARKHARHLADRSEDRQDNRNRR